MAKFDENSTFKDILENEHAKEILNKYMGEDVANNPMVAMMKDKTLGELIKLIPMPDIKEKFQKVLEEIKSL